MRTEWMAALAVSAIALAQPPAEAATPKNALGAVVVSPDGATVYAAGDNRALYVIDAATLDVKARHALGSNPHTLMISADGATLVVHDTASRLIFLSTSDWSRKAVVDDAQAIALAAGADAVVAVGGARRDGGAYTTALKVYALADGAPKSDFAVKGDVQAVAAAPDLSSFTAMTKPVKDDSETRTQPPKDLPAGERGEFEMRNDGNAAEIVILDKAGAETFRGKTWFSASDATTSAHDGTSAYFFGYNNKNAKIGADGSVTFVQLAPRYLYGVDASPDGKRVAAGSLRDGAVHGLADGSTAQFKLDEVEGWPEYFRAFAFAPDGTVFAGTSAYRLIRVGPDGTIQASQPVF